MEHLLKNDEKFDAERDYNSLKVQKRIKDPLFFVPLNHLLLYLFCKKFDAERDYHSLASIYQEKYQSVMRVNEKLEKQV
jgi:hypothetical protein